MRVHELIDKKQEALTDEERQELQKLVSDFTEEVNEVCKKHGLALQATLRYEASAAYPSIDVVKRMQEKDEEKKEEPAEAPAKK